jgi:hypothetical protein
VDEPVPELSCGDRGTGNLVVQGDNLPALKAPLPRFAGQVRRICIDPPYNAGNEGWVYDEAKAQNHSVVSRNVAETAAVAIVEAAEVSRTMAVELLQTTAELGQRSCEPQLALRVQGELPPGTADQPQPAHPSLPQS